MKHILRPGLVPIAAAVLCLGIASAGSKSSRDDAKVAAAKSDMSTLEAAIKMFRLDCNRYPTTKEGLSALRLDQKGLEKLWKGPYLSRKAPVDPWGNKYIYQNPGKTGADSYVLESYGSDGKPGGTGDAADIIGGSD